MPTYGVTPTGFVLKTQPQIVADMNASLQGTFGAQINLTPQSVFSGLVQAFSGPLAEVWQGLQSVYASFWPDSATGANLVQVAGLTGTVPIAASSSSAFLALIGTNGTVVPAGFVGQVSGTPNNFQTTANATIVTVPAWGTATAYAQDVLISRVGNIYQAVISGISGGSGPSGTGASIVDGSVTWRYLGAGSAGVSMVPALEQNTGPIPGPQGTISVIQTPTAGVTSITNPYDAILGTAQESDSALRTQREAGLRATGNAALQSILSAILRVSGVQSAFVYENDNDTADGAGRPPHSFEAIVLGGADAAIAAAIFASKAAGINTYGVTTTVNVIDSLGVSHPINFSRPTAVPIYIIANVKKGATYPPAGTLPPNDGQSLIAAALVNYASANWFVGQSVIDAALYPPCFAAAGISDITSILIGTAPSPTLPTNIAMGIRQLPTLSTANVTVNAS